MRYILVNHGLINHGLPLSLKILGSTAQIHLSVGEIDDFSHAGCVGKGQGRPRMMSKTPQWGRSCHSQPKRDQEEFKSDLQIAKPRDEEFLLSLGSYCLFFHVESVAEHGDTPKKR